MNVDSSLHHSNVQRRSPRLTAIVLTFNEEKHLARCLASLEGVVSHIVVADCFSTDHTLEIARTHGAQVIQHEWVNHAKQFNWALTQITVDTDWILRIDADEYLTPGLAAEIKKSLPELDAHADGAYCGRRMTFQGKLIRHGGVFPIRVLRLFRFGHGQCENRWMDEHIKVDGPTGDLQGEIIDDNLNNLTWWTTKHNNYASREAVDLLNLEYQFMPIDSVADLRSGKQAGMKRWMKEQVYFRMPGGLRAFAYFLYRYVLRIGFMDGYPGMTFHFLQGSWYRYLVDSKVAEVKRYMRDSGNGVVESIRRVLGVSV